MIRRLPESDEDLARGLLGDANSLWRFGVDALRNGREDPLIAELDDWHKRISPQRYWEGLAEGTTRAARKSYLRQPRAQIAAQKRALQALAALALGRTADALEHAARACRLYHFLGAIDKAERQALKRHSSAQRNSDDLDVAETARREAAEYGAKHWRDGATFVSLSWIDSFVARTRTTRDPIISLRDALDEWEFRGIASAPARAMTRMVLNRGMMDAFDQGPLVPAGPARSTRLPVLFILNGARLPVRWLTLVCHKSLARPWALIFDPVRLGATVLESDFRQAVHAAWRFAGKNFLDGDWVVCSLSPFSNEPAQSAEEPGDDADRRIHGSSAGGAFAAGLQGLAAGWNFEPGATISATVDHRGRLGQRQLGGARQEDPGRTRREHPLSRRRGATGAGLGPRGPDDAFAPPGQKRGHGPGRVDPARA